MKRKGRKKQHKNTKKREKEKQDIKTSESLKLWWEELRNINFYYSDYKILFKTGWNTLYVYFAKDILGNYKVRKIIIQSVRHYLKPLEKADHLNHQTGCMDNNFKDSIFQSSADCTRMLHSEPSNNGAIRKRAICLPVHILSFFLLIMSKEASSFFSSS